VLLVLIFAFCVYRAATQSIIIDEAFMYLHFVAPPFLEAMTTYNTNNHIPVSLLDRATTRLFGLSEFTLRIPTLLCCLVYLFATRAVVLAVFSGEWAVITFALLTLHPLVLDLMVAARGYGPALAFLITALLFLLRRQWSGAGISLGLATAANLAFLSPVGSLGAMAMLSDTARKTFGRFIDLVCVPAAVIPFVLYIVPLSRANPEQFEFGAPTMAEALKSYILYSFFDTWPPFGERIIPLLQIVAVLIVAASAVACIYLIRRKEHSPVERLILLNGGALVAGVMMTWIAHYITGAGYPLTRTGVFWIVMIILAGMALLYRFVTIKPLRWTALSLAMVCLALLLTQMRVRYFQEWRYDAGTKRIAALIFQQEGKGKVRVAISPILFHTLDFYRRIYHADWEIIADEQGQAAVYVLLGQDQRHDMKVVYKDSVSGEVLQRQ
jgi:hypothetical protein